MQLADDVIISPSFLSSGPSTTLILFVSLSLTRSPPRVARYAYILRTENFNALRFPIFELNRTFFLSVGPTTPTRTRQVLGRRLCGSLVALIALVPTSVGLVASLISADNAPSLSAWSVHVRRCTHWVNLFAQCRKVRLLSRWLDAGQLDVRFSEDD